MQPGDTEEITEIKLGQEELSTGCAAMTKPEILNIAKMNDIGTSSATQKGEQLIITVSRNDSTMQELTDR